MKRFAFFTDDYPVVDSNACHEDQNENYTGPAIEQLAEYEATGLPPAEVAELKYRIQHDRKRLATLTKLLVLLAKCTKDICDLHQVDAEISYAADVILRIAGILEDLCDPAKNIAQLHASMDSRIAKLEKEMQAGGFHAE